MNWADYFNADSDVVVFGLDWYPTLWLLNAEGPLQLYILKLLYTEKLCYIWGKILFSLNVVLWKKYF